MAPEPAPRGDLMASTLVWFRSDLRIEDNPALADAARREGAVVPVFVWDPDREADWAPGAASRWWLHHSLVALGEALADRGVPFLIRKGPSAQVLRELADEVGATRVVWNRRHEPALVAADAKLERALHEHGLETGSFNAALLIDPTDLANRSGDPYKVFTPFWRALLERGDPPDPVPVPGSLRRTKDVTSLAVDELELLPTIDWAAGLRATWTPGLDGATDQLEHTLDEIVRDYEDDRDRPDRAGTSRLSPHLHFGEIGPRQVWHAVAGRAQASSRRGDTKAAEGFLRQVVWREFAHHLLAHFPHTTDEPLREEFAAFPWRDETALLRRWQKGRTGYPIVDAGMRELWHTGWMHNRVRMVVASFLVKHLLQPWQAGARWFWDTLVDADLASNTLGWQWTAGCGADAAPYFRVFNPILQGKRFDPDGDYVRRWVPELSNLPAPAIHAPWEIAPTTLAEASVELGRTYPFPLVDHGEARGRALAAYDDLKAARP